MDEDERKLDASGGNLDLMTVNASPTSISGLKEADAAGADVGAGIVLLAQAILRIVKRAETLRTTSRVLPRSRSSWRVASSTA